jgi:ferric-dicitrate binding protein FerR (iron transport regulator)
MEQKDDNKIDALIIKYYESKAIEDELVSLELWLNQSVKNQEYFKDMKTLLETSEPLSLSPEKALEKVLNKIGDKKTNRSIWQTLQRVAAVLFIPLLISVFIINSVKNRNEIVNFKTTDAAFGTVSTMELPDGSKVWLNAGSSLKYPEKFTKKERVVFLTGEAYFEVQSNESSPFTVTTPNLSVKATGTRFSVMAYPNSQKTTVTLAEGKVSVKNPEKSDKKESFLLQNQHLSYNNSNGEIDIQNEDPYKHIAGKDGKLVFRNDLITEVARKISMQYNVDIEIQGEKIKNYRFRATFENEPLNELLRLLKLSSPIDYHEIDPKLLPDSTFSRRKIIIYSTES